MALEIDPFAADTYIAGFIQRWGAFDHSALERAFSQGAEDDRLFAINGLGHLGTPEAHALLLPALQSPHPQERWDSAVCLANLGDVQALPVLCSMLTDYLPTRLDDYLQNLSVFEIRRSDAVDPLAGLGDRRAVPCLRGALRQVVELLSQGTTFAEAEGVLLAQLPAQRADFSRSALQHLRDALQPGRRRYLGADG